MKSLAIGISDYKKIIEEHYYYVDKTLFVNELLSHADEVTLICRPRRFGKTLNLSMLRYFFENVQQSHVYLFEDKKIWEHEKSRLQQGKYPVIFVTFKEIKGDSYDEAYEEITTIIAEEFERHESVLMPILSEVNRVKYQAILDQTANKVSFGNALFFLTRLLYQHYNQRVMVFIDEYDTPLHEAYNNRYYKKMVTFIKKMFGKLLKDNSFLERGVLTAILRTAKDGIFSDLNNLEGCTSLHDDYADKFGFTQPEVEQLLLDQQSVCTIGDIKNWYNGYRMGERTLVYNPWSILECFRNKGKLMPYWVSTSGNGLVRNLLARASDTVKKELEDILSDIPIVKTIDEGFTFQSVESNENALWSLLFFSGYITYNHRELSTKGKYICSLVTPNHEIKQLYAELIESIFESSLYEGSKVEVMLHAFTTGNVDLFAELLQQFIINSMSFYDFSCNEPEKSYHIFVLGLLVLLEKSYHMRSNRESGYGRYDIMFFPLDINKPGIIIEFKKAMKQTIEEAAEAALKQIHERQYAQELRAQSIKSIIAYGIAFEGKKVLVRMENIL